LKNIFILLLFSYLDRFLSPEIKKTEEVTEKISRKKVRKMSCCKIFNYY